MFCPKCGKKQNEDQAKFCEDCGIKIPLQVRNFEIKLAPKSPIIELDIDRSEYEVYVKGYHYDTRATLEVNRTGMFIQPVRRLFFSDSPIGVAWGDLRELKNKLQKKRFIANFGIRDSEDPDSVMVLTVKLTGNKHTADRLSSIFDKLPASVYSSMCPACFGSVINDVCENCGKSFSEEHRKLGLTEFVTGAIAMAIGFGILYVFYDPNHFLGVGHLAPIVGGVGFGIYKITRGLIKMISGIRAGRE